MNLQPSQRELDLRIQVQKEIKDAITRQKWNSEKLAERLGLLPVGLEVLMQKQQWPLETSFRIAEAIGLQLEINVKETSEQTEL